MSKRRQKRQPALSRQWLILLGVGIFLLGFGGVALYGTFGSTTKDLTFAGQAISDSALVRGERVYNELCAVCHGVNGEGQPNWKQRNADGSLPAPPHDASGHTWHHADQLLLEIVKNGGSMPNSQMPGYADTLSEDDMIASLAYIKTFWSERELAFQHQVTEQALGQK